MNNNEQNIRKTPADNERFTFGATSWSRKRGCMPITGEEIFSDGETAKVYIKFTNKDGTKEETNLRFVKTVKGWKIKM
jgi:hypothetical protein